MLRCVVIAIFLKQPISCWTYDGEETSRSGDAACPCILEIDNQIHNRTERPQSGYGIGCQQHDLNSSQCNITSPPAWCLAHWCYVNFYRCALTSDRSTYYQHMDFSYATCGYIDDWNGSDLNGTSIRVVYMTNSAGTKGSYCDEPFVASTCYGGLVDFYRTLAAQVGFTLVPVEGFNNKTLEAAGRRGITSKFTTCYLAVGMGFADLCVGSFATNMQRSSFSSYLKWADQPQYLWTLKRDKNEFVLLRAFEPFSTSVWLAILLCATALSLIASYLNNDLPALRDAEWNHKTMVRKLFDVGAAAFTAATRGVMELSTQAVPFKATHPSARLVEFGFAFFALVVLSTYTANLANILIQDTVHTEVKDLEDALARQIPICINPADEITIKFAFPNMIYVTPSFQDRLNRLVPLHQINSKPGTCGAIMLSSGSVSTMNGKGEACNLVRLGTPMMHVILSQPVSRKFHRALASAVYIRKDTIWPNLLVKHRLPSRCNFGAEDEGSVIDLQHMAGTVIITASFGLFGLILRCVGSLVYSHVDDGNIAKKDFNIEQELSKLNQKMDKIMISSLQHEPAPAEEMKI